MTAETEENALDRRCREAFDALIRKARSEGGHGDIGAERNAYFVARMDVQDEAVSRALRSSREAPDEHPGASIECPAEGCGWRWPRADPRGCPVHGLRAPAATGESAAAPHFFDKRAADAMAREVQKLIDRKVIDSRSPAADALLDYVNPDATESVIGKLAAATGESAGGDPEPEAPREVYFARWLASRPCECAPGRPPCFPCGARAATGTEARALAPSSDPALAEWYEADGSVTMLPAEEVARRRKLAAKVIERVRELAGAKYPAAAIGRLMCALHNLDAAPSSDTGSPDTGAKP